MRIFSSASANLLYNLVRRDLTVRYKSTVLGFFWSFIKPLALTGIFYLVFDRILDMGSKVPGGGKIPFALFLLTGMLAWNFFAGATSESLNLILANSNLIKKVKLPLWVFPLATVISQLVHYVLALLLLFALLILNGLTPGLWALALIPALAILFVFVYGLSLILASLNVFYRDVGSIWEVGLTAWLYATPIIYPFSAVREVLAKHNLAALEHLYLLNPLAPVMLVLRRALLYAPLGSASLEFGSDFKLMVALLIAAAVAVCCLFVGLAVFKKYSRQFADEL